MSETEALHRIEAARKLGKPDLEITYLKLERLPDALFELSFLRTIVAHNNRLAALPEGLWGMARLEGLFLEFNRLTELPPEIALLSNLKVLSVTGNRLTTLPEAIFDTRLEELYLAGNSLKALPPGIGRLRSLRKLYVGEAQLRSLPAELGALTELRALHVPNNLLTVLPRELEGLSRLQVLNASGNRLTAIDPRLAALPSLRTLNLSKNPLPEAVLEAARSGPAACKEAAERFVLQGIRLAVAGNAPLNELRAALSAVEHAFNGFLVFERVALDVSRSKGGPVPLPEWPITPEVIAGRVQDAKRLFVRDMRWGLTGTVELATRSPRTAALRYLAAVINAGTGRPAEPDPKKILARKIAPLKKVGGSAEEIQRLTADLVRGPGQAVLAFVHRGIIRSATLA